MHLVFQTFRSCSLKVWLMTLITTNFSIAAMVWTCVTNLVVVLFLLRNYASLFSVYFWPYKWRFIHSSTNFVNIFSIWLIWNEINIVSLSEELCLIASFILTCSKRLPDVHRTSISPSFDSKPSTFFSCILTLQLVIVINIRAHIYSCKLSLSWICSTILWFFWI